MGKIDAIKGYTNPIFGGKTDSDASAIRARKPEDNLGSMLASGNINPQTQY